ncbi:hypothetical protein ALC57_05591 [Trachymyrmex cornetzi]|uniref:DNA-directed DNA polymerase n=1 Tax=Trachymyrmex cornetzi TaxID=471704 RepID=A0A151JAB8_9HYME|nr:hypothetical protein ALC57_05591 [Trachymyrmex cornetzi]
MDEEVEDLFNLATSIDTVDIYRVWEQKCDEYLDFLRETCRNSKHRRTSTGIVNASIVRLARLEGLRNVLQRFEHVDSGRVESQKSGFSWLEIETAFNNRVLTVVVLNSSYIEPRQFLDDARDIIIDRIRDNLQRHICLKVNTMLNGEFVADAKRSAKSITTKNYELFDTFDLREWYDEHVTDDILAALEEFQERDSGWALSCISNLIVNVNKYNPMHAECWVELPRKIMLKKAVINVRSMENACFAWSVVAALYPAERNVNRKSSYPDYTTVLKLEGIEFPVTLKQITKFEFLNDISTYLPSDREVEKKETMVMKSFLFVLPKGRKRNMLYLQDSKRNDENVIGNSTWIKNLSRLIDSQLSYDAHFIIKNIANSFAGRVDLLPITKEKYISFMKHVKDTVNFKRGTDYLKLRFVDSFKFLNTSLEKLVSYLNKSKLKIIRSEFSNLDVEDFDLLTRKGVFPYEYIDSVDNLNETSLSPRELFYSSLTDETASDDDYQHATNVWRRFCIETLGDYSDLYLKTDVLLLADVFENFRDTCIESYIIKRDIVRFDTNDYPERNAYDIPRVNNKIAGNVVAKTITFDNYARCLNDVTIQSRRQSCIRSTLHGVYTVSELKLALSPYDDKRYVVPESVTTLPCGRYKIPL